MKRLRGEDEVMRPRHARKVSWLSKNARLPGPDSLRRRQTKPPVVILSVSLSASTFTFLIRHAASVICMPVNVLCILTVMFNSFVYCNLCRRVIEKSHERVLVAKGWKQFDANAEIEKLTFALARRQITGTVRIRKT